MAAADQEEEDVSIQITDVLVPKPQYPNPNHTLYEKTNLIFVPLENIHSEVPNAPRSAGRICPPVYIDRQNGGWRRFLVTKESKRSPKESGYAQYKATCLLAASTQAIKKENLPHRNSSTYHGSRSRVSSTF